MKSKNNLAAICLTTVLAMGAAGADYIFAQNSSSGSNASNASKAQPTATSTVDYTFAQNSSTDSNSSNGGYAQATPTPTVDNSKMYYDPDITPVIKTQKTPGAGRKSTPVVSPTESPDE